MAYIFEFDELRREVPKSEARTLPYWPKVSGTGNVLVTAASYTVIARDGSVLQSSASVTPVTVEGVSRLDLSIPPIADVGEDYRVDVTFDVTGGPAGIKALFFFDVVLWPLLDSEPIALNDLRDHRADVGRLLTRLGAPHEKTAEEMATMYGFRGYAQIDSWIRASGWRPHAILNRERVRRVVILLALKAAYFSAADDPEGEGDKLGKIYRHYQREAQAAWAEMQPLKFHDAAAAEIKADKVVEHVASIVQSRRVAPP